MRPAILRMAVFGFGLELGSIYALCCWPEAEHIALPLVYLGGCLLCVSTILSVK